MIILKKYIKNGFACCFCFCFISKTYSQEPLLFINGKHEYVKYSSQDLFYNDRIVNSHLNDSLHKAGSNVSVRLRIIIGQDILWSDTFNFKRYFYLKYVITGFITNIKQTIKEFKKDDELFGKKNDEAYLPFILYHYKILDNYRKNKKGLKYFIVEFDDSIWKLGGFKYCSHW